MKKEIIRNIGDIELKKPIKFSMIKDNNEYVANIEKLNLYSYGYNKNKVIEKLKNDLLELYLDLFYTNYKLAKPAIKLKDKLKNHING